MYDTYLRSCCRLSSGWGEARKNFKPKGCGERQIYAILMNAVRKRLTGGELLVAMGNYRHQRDVIFLGGELLVAMGNYRHQCDVIFLKKIENTASSDNHKLGMRYLLNMFELFRLSCQ